MISPMIQALPKMITKNHDIALATASLSELMPWLKAHNILSGA